MTRRHRATGGDIAELIEEGDLSSLSMDDEQDRLTMGTAVAWLINNYNPRNRHGVCRLQELRRWRDGRPSHARRRRIQPLERSTAPDGSTLEWLQNGDSGSCEGRRGVVRHYLPCRAV